MSNPNTTPSDPTDFESNWDEIVDSFDSMNLNENLLRGIYAYGFEKPSLIQQRAIVPLSKRYDIIAQAQSGTGKTATFTIGILQQIDFELLECQALILSPTRELAQQIHKVVSHIGDFLRVRCHACVGGTRVSIDRDELTRGVHIVVGTPGRVYDMIVRKVLRPQYIKIFILDEADEMLSKGFKDQNLRHLHFFACTCPSWTILGYHVERSFGNDQQVHEQARQDLSEERRIDLRRYPSVLHRRRSRRVQI